MTDSIRPFRTRLESIDVVRGVIMIIMALDHTRDFFGIPGQSPTDLSTTTSALFFTRWITNICAPVFFLLTGTGAWLSRQHTSTREVSRFLLTRGVWLLFLELVVVRCLAYQFNVDYQVTMLLVLWALGWAMIALAALVHLPTRIVTAIGIAMIVGHNLLDLLPLTGPVWSILHAPGFVLPGPDQAVFVSYPLIPWIGVTAVGYGLGQLYGSRTGLDGQRRRTLLLRLGVGVCVGFLLLRGVNVYGDPVRWTSQSSTAFSVLSFLNTTKYPPSLLYLLMTLGPALLLLRAVDRGTPTALRPALVIGRVPLFYYLLHFMLIHMLAVGVCYLRYGSAHWMFESPDVAHYPFSAPPGWGYSLPVIYLIWAAVVFTMYPLCRWFGGVKQRRNDAWLSYL